MKKKRPDLLEGILKLVKENGLTYSEFQRMESLGQAKIVNGRLLIKGRDY